MIEITELYLTSQELSNDFPQRFWEKIIKTDSCWISTHPQGDKVGHRTLTRGQPFGAKAIYAHRASWILNVGPIPSGQWVLHNCPGTHNPACVNPEHLKLGDHSMNQIDRKLQGQMKWCKLTPSQIEEIRNTKGIPQHEIGRHFHVSQSAISKIMSHKNWK
jgi:hypothetical protein